MRMKLRLLLKSIILTTLFLIAGKVGWGQVLLNENFNHSVGTSLISNGWTEQGGPSAVNVVSEVAGNLFYTDYAASNWGNMVAIANNGQDVYKSFASQNSGTVYLSALINISAANTAGDYFLSFEPVAASTLYNTRIFIKRDATTNLAFGISKGSTSIVTYTGFTYSLNTTYLIVAKYTFVAGLANDNVDLFISPTVGVAEPAATISYTDVASTDATAEAAVLLRQGSTANAATLTIDGLRVGTTWNDVAGIDLTAPTKTFTPANLATYIVTTTNITINYNEVVRNLDNSVINNANVGALLTLKETNSSGADVAFTGTIDVASQIITINPDVDLIANKVYYVAIADVEDINNNLAAGSNITFTTIDPTAPYIADVTIAETSPYVAGSNITVKWKSANVDNVKIDEWVPSSTAWVEKSASTINDGSEVISLPADAMYSADYKIRVSYVTDNLVNAESAPFAIIAIPTIHDIQSKTIDGDLSIYDGSVVRFNGIVTAKKASGSGYFVQSGEGDYNGIYVYGPVAAVTVGDNVTIEGTVDEYFSLTEIASPKVTVNSSGNALPAPKTITTGEMLEAYEGVLIKIVNAGSTSISDGNGVFTIDDGSGVTSVDNDFYTFSSGGGERLTITGLGYYSFAFKILPRDASDIKSAYSTVSSSAYFVDNDYGIISSVPYVVTVADFKANLTPALDASFQVYDADGTTPATVIDDTKLVIVTAGDGITKRTYTIMRIPLKTGKAILTFNFTTPSAVGTVNTTDHTVALTVPFGTVVTALVPTITISDGATISPLTGVAADFTAPVKYTVTAEDLSTQDWMVTVTVTAGKTGKDILTFNFGTPSVVGTVNASAHTVALTVPSGTAVTALIPTITLSDGASISPLSGVAQNFTAPVTYTVTAEDLSTQDWVATVNIATGFENGSLVKFKVYPNPFNNEIILDGVEKQCKVFILSLNGQVLIEKLITKQDNKINTNSLKSGVYMITIVEEKGERNSQKMFKK